MLNFFYTNALQPLASPFSAKLLKNFMSINQTAYVRDFPPDAIGMAESGLAYVPSKCWRDARSCDIHVQYHGCAQGGMTLDYAEILLWVELPYVAETNGIIILY